MQRFRQIFFDFSAKVIGILVGCGISPGGEKFPLPVSQWTAGAWNRSSSACAVCVLVVKEQAEKLLHPCE
jgi:hypothetical protein